MLSCHAAYTVGRKTYLEIGQQAGQKGIRFHDLSHSRYDIMPAGSLPQMEFGIENAEWLRQFAKGIRT